MTNWISFDWDYVTSDCRTPYERHACVQRCDGCGDSIGRGSIMQRTYRADFSRKLYAKVKHLLLNSNLQRVIVADNHADIFQFLEDADFVYNIDYHTDDYHSGYDYEYTDLHCANWVSYATTEKNCIVQQVDAEQVPVGGVYNLFVAISRPYTPPAMDGWLLRLLMELPHVEMHCVYEN